MRKFTIIALLAAVAVCLLPSCNEEDTTAKLNNAYEEWYKKNKAWLDEEVKRTNEDGSPYYQTVIPDWDPNAYVLVHYFNDRAETEGNLSPMYTSLIDTRYWCAYYDGTPLDSSTLATDPAPGIFRCQLSGVISGWAIAMEQMRVGDTAEVVIPYQQAYGTSLSAGVPPYSNLRYNIRLVDIVDYEKNPK